MQFFNLFGLILKSGIIQNTSRRSATNLSNAVHDVNISDLESNIHRLLIKQGHSIIESDVITKTLMYAELRGNNQGIVKLVTGGLTPANDKGTIKVVYETPVSAKLTGGQNIGMVVVSECVDIAIKKAKSTGIGMVGCSNYSSATGALGHWALKIAESNLIGVILSQCPEYMAPYGSYEPIFGTNPLAISIPTQPRIQVLDMATSACTYYHLVTAKQEEKSISGSLAYDSTGQPTTNPTEALKGALMVFDRNYKGSHLALMIELLSGALTGAAMENKTEARNWGSLIVAIDPNIFGPDTLTEFQRSTNEMCHRVKNAKKLPGRENEEIFLPGERGDSLRDANLAKGTITMSKGIYDDLLRQISKTEEEEGA